MKQFLVDKTYLREYFKKLPQIQSIADSLHKAGFEVWIKLFSTPIYWQMQAWLPSKIVIIFYNIDGATGEYDKIFFTTEGQPLQLDREYIEKIKKPFYLGGAVCELSGDKDIRKFAQKQ